MRGFGWFHLWVEGGVLGFALFKGGGVHEEFGVLGEVGELSLIGLHFI